MGIKEDRGEGIKTFQIKIINSLKMLLRVNM